MRSLILSLVLGVVAVTAIDAQSGRHGCHSNRGVKSAWMVGDMAFSDYLSTRKAGWVMEIEGRDEDYVLPIVIAGKRNNPDRIIGEVIIRYDHSQQWPDNGLWVVANVSPEWEIKKAHLWAEYDLPTRVTPRRWPFREPNWSWEQGDNRTVAYGPFFGEFDGGTLNVALHFAVKRRK
ncbi:MAG: hypothetical protein GY922_14435 [Proteobacteria bacterium]|nr:hypothetical protein [Pseudomonadota bacterium]